MVSAPKAAEDLRKPRRLMLEMGGFMFFLDGAVVEVFRVAKNIP